MSKRILVTGGCGFLGSNLCKRLVTEGHNVLSLDNESRGSRRVDGVEYITGDVRSDPYGESNAGDSGFDYAFRDDIDAVFHLAAINGTRYFYERPEEVLDVQIRGTLNVLDACKANGVKELILFSSSEVYGQADQIPTPETVPLKIADPFNPRFSYAAGKIAAEMMCLHAKHLDRVLVIRPHNVYGPDMGFEHVIPELAIRIARSGNQYPVDLRGAYTARAYCYVDDFIDGVMTAWNCRAGGVYHIGTEAAVMTTDLARLISDVIGFHPPICPVSAADGGPLTRCPNTKKLRGFGWEPATSLFSGLRSTWQWLVRNEWRWPK